MWRGLVRGWEDSQEQVENHRRWETAIHWFVLAAHLPMSGSWKSQTWERHIIDSFSRGADGVKYDLVQLVDLDADGDLDVLTCEELANLGVFGTRTPRANT
ncbi:MAG: hypothetical protein ACUVX8_16915 [Candidatus Zipacnadales bacterium]